MVDNKFHIEVPIIGEQQISLYEESRQIYELFKDEILRLKDIMQLGALHYFSEKLFRYTRYDHILTMLLLISRLEELDKLKEIEKKTTKRRLSTRVKLNGVEFSSISELLKSWTLLYPIGHFQMTFAAEHAFLRWIKSKESRESEFLDLVREQIKKSKLFKQEPKVKEDLYNRLAEIITQERIMQVHKIFTFLKILKKAEELQDDDTFIPKLRELVKLMIFREKYPNYEDPERVKDPEHIEKILDIVRYFLVLRELSFTILDGYVAQSPIQLSYHTVLNVLPLFIENEHYKNVIDDVEKFYTKTLYQSAEGAYYHLRAVNVIEDKIFGKYRSVKDFISDVFSNENEIDKRLVEIIELESKQITEEKHQGRINTVISTSMELILKHLPAPVSTELKYFDTIPGTILYNMASKEYQIFIYPSLIQEDDPLKKIYYLLRISEILYLPLVIFNKSRGKDFMEHLSQMSLKRKFLEKALFESSKLASHILEEIFGNKVLVQRKKLRPLSLSIESLLKSPLKMLKLRFPLFSFTLPIPSLVTSEYLNLYLKQFESLPETKLEKGKFAEQYHLLDILRHYIDKKKFEWYLIALDTKLIKEKEVQAELDILVIGFSPKHLMISISEVKSGKHKRFNEQLKRYESILESLKTKFESHGYNVELKALDNISKDRDIKTQILEIWLS